MTEKLLKWLIFAAAISILPLLFTYIALYLKSAQSPFLTALGGGELFLITWVLSSTALGELISGGPRNSPMRIIAAGGSVLVLLILSASLYVLIADDRASAQPSIDATRVSMLSVAVFFGALGASAACIALSEQSPT